MTYKYISYKINCFFIVQTNIINENAQIPQSLIVFRLMEKTDLERMGVGDAIEFLEDLRARFKPLLAHQNVYYCKIIQVHEIVVHKHLKYQNGDLRP